MAENKKINDLTELAEAPAADDEFVVWDKSAGSTKKVTKANAVDAQADASVAAHAALTETHGAEGAVVGTTNTQTLTNKTLTSPTINGATIDNATINSPAGLVKEDVGLGNVNNAAQVELAGNQTIEGIKTFSSSPIVPEPTTDLQAATKKYVDDLAGVGEWAVLGSTTTASLDVSSIDPDEYDEFRITARVRFTTSGTSQQILPEFHIRVNNDSGSNYWQRSHRTAGDDGRSATSSLQVFGGGGTISSGDIAERNLSVILRKQSTDSVAFLLGQSFVHLVTSGTVGITAGARHTGMWNNLASKINRLTLSCENGGSGSEVFASSYILLEAKKIPSIS
jgi:hypothetical protein